MSEYHQRGDRHSERLFTPGRFELFIPEDTEIGVREFKLNRDASSIFTFGGSLSAVSKTLGPFTGEIHVDATGEPIATLDDVRATVTHMTGQQNQSFLLCTLEYLVTSHGWRTGDGRNLPGATTSFNPSHEPIGAAQQVNFQNSAGGTMRAIGFDVFRLNCNDNRKYQMIAYNESMFLGWFDDWAAFSHLVHGVFFRC
jgi:hypothetical protein